MPLRTMYFSLSRLLVVLLSLGITLANGTSRCEENFCNGTEFMSEEFLCGDQRLGVLHLPTSLPFAPLLSGYKRLGGLCPDAPPANGFQLSTAHKPIVDDEVLHRGMLVDCFGTMYETFLFPAGTPFSMRSLPPSSINTPTYDDIALFNYRVFKVEYPFVVASGPTAPFYGQPGQGTVYKTRANIDMLVRGGFLTRVQ
ncbi:hypothetical protein C8R43DRAFT_1018271 [Mycena crocata]|nr:hypothetical protein C8R43DRAFT_1018271 [Mycena crocata]